LRYNQRNNQVEPLEAVDSEDQYSSLQNSSKCSLKKEWIKSNERYLTDCDLLSKANTSSDLISNRNVFQTRKELGVSKSSIQNLSDLFGEEDSEDESAGSSMKKR